ncbi:MAG: PEP-CTERM sorting domain-containing protein [Phycisphaerales bacterium]
MKKMQCLWSIGMSGAALLAGVVAQSPAAVVFQDDFDNGVPTQTASESPTNWVYAVGTGAGDLSTASETGTTLTLTATSNVGNGGPSANMNLRATSSSMNFWLAPVTMTLSGMSRRGTVVNAGKNVYGAFVSQAENTNATNSAVEFRFFDLEYVRIGWKANAANRVGTNISNSLQISTVLNRINGAEFTLDGTGSQLAYELRFATSANPMDTNSNGFIDYLDTGKGILKGLLSVTDTTTLRNAWLADNGVGSVNNAQAAVTIATARTNNSAESSIFNLDQLTVSSAIPEPATLGLLAMGGLVMLAPRRK